MTKKNEQKQGFGPLFFSDLLEKFVGIMGKLLSAKLFNFLKKWILLVGQWAFYGASGIALLSGIIGAIRLKSANVFFTSLAFAIGFFVVQYVGNKFLNAGDVLIEKNPTRMSSAAFLDSFAFASIIINFLFYFFIGPIFVYRKIKSKFCTFVFFTFYNNKTIMVVNSSLNYHHPKPSPTISHNFF